MLTHYLDSRALPPRFLSEGTRKLFGGLEKSMKKGWRKYVTRWKGEGVDMEHRRKGRYLENKTWKRKRGKKIKSR